MEQQLSIALVQTSLEWQNPDKNRIKFAKKIREVESPVDLIILPEMFTTGFTMTPRAIDKTEGPKTLEWLRTMSKEKNAAIIGSVVYYENQQFTNRLFFVEPNGQFQYYDKRHTFTLAGEHLAYAKGEQKLIVSYKGFKICPLICYDLRFPVWARNTEHYDVLLYVANWPKPRILAWDTLLQARAIENMAYCIGVNRVGQDENGHEYIGHSACYNALGEQIAFGIEDATIKLIIKKEHLNQTRTKLRFLDDQDAFSFL